MPALVPRLQACITFVAETPERLTQVLASPGYLYLNETAPAVGQWFVSAAMQHLLAKK